MVLLSGIIQRMDSGTAGFVDEAGVFEDIPNLNVSHLIMFLVSALLTK